MPVRLDREAWVPAAVGSIPALLAWARGHRRTAAALGLLPLALAAFFRDPDRSVDVRPADPDAVLAPADGRVMYVGPAQDGVAPAPDPQGPWQQVSIFLSVFDVHINRAPYAGRVLSVTHRPGRWHAAYRFESATQNERSEITTEAETPAGVRRIVYRQIVGLLARRVVTRIAAGDELHTGERIGLMKFGSRMDVFLPADVALRVVAGDRTVAGETVIGRWFT